MSIWKKIIIILATGWLVWFGGASYLYVSLNIVNEDPEFCQKPTYMMLATWPVWMVNNSYARQLERDLIMSSYKMCDDR